MTARSSLSPPEGSVLRFAVAMRGGVSLAVWIGVAFSAIDNVRNPLSDGFARRILAITRFGRLEVDILTGASAGGLTAALGALAIAPGAPMALRRRCWGGGRPTRFPTWIRSDRSSFRPGCPCWARGWCSGGPSRSP